MDSAELYQLFLALCPARVEAARAALMLDDAGERARVLNAAMTPLAVDATLLGAEGVSALAQALANAADAPADDVEAGLDELLNAAEALGHGDESGARVDETALKELASRLGSGTVQATPRAARAADRPPVKPSAAVVGDAPDEDARWVPELAEDMVAAFLDECAERLEGLAERLLVLEKSGENPELVNEIFRDLHTLKGSSAFAGLKKLNRVAHLAEDLIGALRDGKRSCDRDLIDVLLDTLDVLRIIVDRARSDQPIDVDVRELCERLRDPTLKKSAIAAPAPTAGSAQAKSSAAAGAAPRAAAPQATLRIDFEKVDQLLNLVGEVVLARGRLSAAAEAQSALLREVVQLRKRVVAASDNQRARAEPAISGVADDLQRTERVLRETYGDFDSGLSGLGLAVGQLRDNVMKLRMVPIARLFTKYQRTVRELSNKLGKEVDVVLEGADTELDKVLVERLEDPLLHLVRNAVDHGVETPEQREATGKPRRGTLTLGASQRGGQIVVKIQDDGHGMDPEKLRRKAVEKGVLSELEAEVLSEHECYELIFRAGFSTAAQVSDVSGRGVGMDVVRDAIGKLKGTIALDSTLGQGTTLELRLPLTLAITQVLAARVGGELLAVPLDAVVSAQAIRQEELEPVADGACLRVGDELIPVVALSRLLGFDDGVALEEAREQSVVIVETGAEKLALLVQQVLGRHEVVIKSLGPLLARAPCAAGATLIGDRVLLVVDLAEVAMRAREPGYKAAPPRQRTRSASTRAHILVAEDSDVIRESIRRALASAGFEVTTAEDGKRALSLAEARVFDAVSTDVMMPGMDGYELTRALRADPRYHDVPIVMVTSKDARIDTLRGYDAGADAYLTKPADADELVRTLDRLLAAKREQ